jgi:hypothetical protein
MEQETVQHLFFYCPMARHVWGIVCLTFGITKPVDVENLFGPWLRSFSSKPMNLVLIGMAAFCWALWISRNDLVFQKSQYKFIFQVIFRGTFWIRSLSVISKEEGRIILKKGCRALESVALEIFHKSGWNALKCINFELLCVLYALSNILFRKNFVCQVWHSLGAVVSGV